MGNPVEQSSKITHILFDFFGTLVEYSDSRTEQGYAQSHQILLSKLAVIDYEEFLRRLAKTFSEYDARSERNFDEYSMDDVVSAFLSQVLSPEVVQGTVTAFRETYLQEWNKGVRYINGVSPMLKQLAKQYTLVLVTNTHSAELVRTHLRNMEVAECFSGIVTSVELGKRKPDASIFQHALNITSGNTSAAIYVGDSLSADYLGAKGFGMRCLLIDPASIHDIPAEDRIASVLDLQNAIESG